MKRFESVLKRKLLLKALAESYHVGSSDYSKIRRKLDIYVCEVWAIGLEKQRNKVKHLLLRWSNCSKHPCYSWVRGERSNSGGSKLAMGAMGVVMGEEEGYYVQSSIVT